jgi:hypothetical protein
MSDLFNSADQASQSAPVTEGAPGVAPSAPSPFTALVGESGKYKTPDELAKAYIHADTFIEQLKAENAQLRAKTQEAATLDQVLERLSKKEVESVPSDSGSLTADQVAEIVQQQITGLETAKTRQTNLTKADQAMKERFGDKALDVFNAKANTPELKRIYKELAETAPDQFVALFGSFSEGPKGSMETPTVNSAGVANAPRVKEWSKSWVAQVRKENPMLYKSAQFQADLMKNADKYFS